MSVMAKEEKEEKELAEYYIKGGWPKSVESCHALLERYDNAMRSMCFSLSVGGYNNENPKSPEYAEECIRDGIDMLTAPISEAAHKYWKAKTEGKVE